MKYFYYIVSIFHLLAYMLFRYQIKEIDEDLVVWTNGKTGNKAFLSQITKKEYRNIFYYRLPFVIRHFLNLILPRVNNCKIQCSNIGGGVKIHHGWSAIILANKILYILKHNPWGIGGGCYACRNYLELFTELFKSSVFEVLICEEYMKDIQSSEFPNCKFIPVPPRSKFSQYLSPITHILHRHQGISTKMLQQNHYDYCIFDHNSIAGSLADLCKKRKIKTIVLNHNCELEYFRDNHSKLKNKLLLPSVRSNEKNAYLKCDYNIFLTEEDKEIFQQIYGPSQTHSLVGGCFLNKNEIIEPNITPFNTKNPKIVISGTIGNLQNLDGINYFLDKLYPTLPQNAQIIIAGKNPPVVLTERIKHYPNIQIIPNPKDILSIIRTCDIFLCPTRLGGGMKLRIMDGLRCCIPILTHKVSARGYKAFERKGYLYQFENEQEFLNAFHQLITLIKTTPNLKKDMAVYNENITFEEKIKNFKAQFASCTK